MLNSYSVYFYHKAERDIGKLSSDEQGVILDKIERDLASNPFPHGKVKKKIKGIKTALYRLRVETPRDSYRVFYIVEDDRVAILRVVKKKEADRVIQGLK